MANGEVVPIPKLPALSKRARSVREPLVFLVEKVRAEAIDASLTSVRIEAIREVEVAVVDAVTVERNSLLKSNPAPIPFAAVELDMWVRFKISTIDDEFESMIVPPIAVSLERDVVAKSENRP